MEENAGRAAKRPANPNVCLAARFNASLLDSLGSSPLFFSGFKLSIISESLEELLIYSFFCSTEV